MAFKGTIEKLGGNGLVGFCKECDTLVPAFLRPDGRHYCANHGKDTDRAPRREKPRTFTRTIRHVLIVINELDAFCRSCQRIVRHEPDGHGGRRCQSVRRSGVTGRGRTVPKVIGDELIVPSTCMVCGRTFRSLGLFDEHLDPGGHCPGSNA
jgi:hypothetical protein